MSLRSIQGESDCESVDTSSYHLKTNKNNVKLVSSLTTGRAFLMAPCFLCCSEPPIVCDPLFVVLDYAVWSHPAVCYAVLS